MTTDTFPRVTLPGVETGTLAAELMVKGKEANEARQRLAYRFAWSMRRRNKHVYLHTVTAKVKEERRNGKSAGPASRRRARHAESVAKRSEWARR